MTATMYEETVRSWNPVTQQWDSVTVQIPAQPRRKRTARRTVPRRGQPRDLAGLSDQSPIPAWWRDTAFYPGDLLADMRTYLPAPAMRTHRAPAVVPASPEVYAPPAAR